VLLRDNCAVVPAHSASKTRVNALMLGTHIPDPVVMGPRFRGDDHEQRLTRPDSPHVSFRL
jgi:hypothetical protein